MKNLKAILYSILATILVISCDVNGLDDNTNVTTTPSSNLAKIFDISTDNTGMVKITPTGQSVSSFLVNFGNGTGTAGSATLSPGQSTYHKYPEGSYTVTITSYDIAGNATTTTYPLVITYVAPKNLVVNINSDMSLKATATYANSFLVNYGDGTSAVLMNTTIDSSTAVATGTLPAHIYPAGGPYTLTVTAQSGGAATTVFTKTLFGLPITFETAAVDYFFGTFGNVNFTKVANPSATGINTSATVGKYEKTVGAATWSGTYSPLNIPINFAYGKKIKVMVYNPDPANIGKTLNVELESAVAGTGATANGVGVLKVPFTKSGVWEQLTFDFSTISAIPATARFGQLVLRFNDSASGTGEVFYVDNFEQSN